MARPTTEVARGGRGVAGAPRCETGSTAAGGGARRGQRWTSARQGEAQAGGGDKGYDDGGGRGGSALQPTNGQQREGTAARCGIGRGSGGSGAGSAAGAAAAARAGAAVERRRRGQGQLGRDGEEERWGGRYLGGSVPVTGARRQWPWRQARRQSLWRRAKGPFPEFFPPGVYL